MYAPYRKGLIKPSYGGLNMTPISNPYGLRLARRNPYGSYGALTPDQQRMAVGAAGLGVLLVIAGAWTFAVGPWAVKQFKPEWSYGKRLVTSFLAGTLIGVIKRAFAPDVEINVPGGA